MFCLHDCILFDVEGCINVCLQAVFSGSFDCEKCANRFRYGLLTASSLLVLFAQVPQSFMYAEDSIHLQAQNRYEKVPKMILSAFQWSSVSEHLLVSQRNN